MKIKDTLIYYLLPPVLCLLLGFLLVFSHKGAPLEPRPVRLEPLGATETDTEHRETEILLLAESDSVLLGVVQDTLDEMKIGWVCRDTIEQNILDSVHSVLLCAPDLASLRGENAIKLIEWVDQGGRLCLMAAPSRDGWFQIVSHKLGILESGEYFEYHAVNWSDGTRSLFPSLIFDEELEDYTMSVFLEEDCRVLMSTADENQIPLLWGRDLGKGRIAVCNHSLISGKDARGFVLQALEAIEPVLIYPIINAGLIYIDDFPAPQPEGFDENLRAQYGLTTQSFYRNHWWPDMKTLARTYALRYTGVLVETYNKNMTPPFIPDMDDNSLIRYYASELLQTGGEIGLHGYNHQPLCLDGWEYAGEDYITWSSEENMALAVKELVRYGKSFLPDAEFTSYVPPSNYLSEEGQKVLLQTVPSLLAISGLYLPEEGVNALVQEFHENADGSVPVPRITSGFSMGNYEKTVAEGELSLHGIFSHFIHPDDVLDEERGALLGWEQLYQDFNEMLQEVNEAFPALRWCTATEAAAAVQRYDRVDVERSWEGQTVVLNLSNFYDEAWFCLSAAEQPLSVEGADIFRAGKDLWLRAYQPEVRLTWENEA